MDMRFSPINRLGMEGNLAHVAVRGLAFRRGGHAEALEIVLAQQILRTCFHGRDIERRDEPREVFMKMGHVLSTHRW